MLAQALDRFGARPLLRRALEVDQEKVVAELAPTRTRLDLGQADAAEGELAQAAHEPARRVVACAREQHRGLERPRTGRGAGAGGGEHHEACRVVTVVLDALP